MGHIITIIVLLLIALGIYLWNPGYDTVETEKIRDNEYPVYGREVQTKHHTSLRKLFLVPLGIAVALVLLGSFTQVHAKEIGVGVSFGKPVAEYDAGPHIKPFWQSVTKMDATTFTDSYGTDTNGAQKAITVRLGDGNPAKAKTTIRWHINPKAVDYIYATYRSNNPVDNLRDAVVETQYTAVVNAAFGDFNPTEDSTKADFTPDYAAVANDITAGMLDAVKDATGISLIIIDKVTVSGVDYSKKTEARIDSLVQQAAKTQQANELKATNTSLAEANEKLKTSLDGEAGTKALVQQCLADLADGKFVAPAGFSCWPGSGSSVVIPSAGGK